MRRTLLFASVFLVSACSASSIFHGESDIDRLHRERDAWRALGVHNYTFQYRNGCFCPPEITDPVRIEVRADTVFAVFNLRTQKSESLQRTYYAKWPTIDSVFADAETFFGVKEQRVDIDYDATWHFPASVVGTMPPTILDGGATISVTGFVKAP